MNIFKKKPCNEATCILNHMDNLSMGLESKEPDPSYPIHINMLERFNRLHGTEKKMGEVTKNIMSIAIEISGFDVELSHSATQLTSFAEELNDVSTSNLAIVEQTSASMSEVSDTVLEINNTLESLSNSSKQLTESNNLGLIQIDNIVEIKENVLSNTENMKNQIGELIEMTKKINGIVSTVESIVSKTNLLSLNASIEAARAGEAGKGFAVVASEIRKLAENTKDSLNSMQGFVKGIQETSTNSIKGLNDTIYSTEIMSNEIDKVKETIHSNVNMLNNTMDGFEKISHSLSGVNGATLEINKAMESSSRDAEKLTSMTTTMYENAQKAELNSKQISKIDENLSRNVKDALATLHGGKYYFNREEFINQIEKAIASHKIWLEKLVRIVKNRDIEPLQTNHSKCAFGHFYHSVQSPKPELKNKWEELGQYHKEFHDTGTKTIDAIMHKKWNDAETALVEAEKLSEKVIALLTKIKNEI